MRAYVRIEKRAEERYARVLNLAEGLREKSTWSIDAEAKLETKNPCPGKPVPSAISAVAA